MSRRKWLFGWEACFLCLVLAACGGDRTVYRPPTAIVTASSLPTIPATPGAATNKPPEGILPTATPSCTNNLRYVEDLSIPDGSITSPAQQLDKRWHVENSGTCNWDERYTLRLIAGSSLEAPTDQALYPARVGTKLVIRILFTSPKEPGAYRSAWQAYDPVGQPFGDPIFIDIIVQ